MLLSMLFTTTLSLSLCKLGLSKSVFEQTFVLSKSKIVFKYFPLWCYVLTFMEFFHPLPPFDEAIFLTDSCNDFQLAFSRFPHYQNLKSRFLVPDPTRMIFTRKTVLKRLAPLGTINIIRFGI